MGREHREIPWLKIQRMWEAGADYGQIARAIDRWDGWSVDPNAPIRKIISRGIREGFTGATGKREYLKFRPKPQPQPSPSSPKPKTKAEWLECKQQQMKKRMYPLKFKKRGIRRAST